MTPESEAAIALSRLGIGARPGERAALGKGARASLARQAGSAAAFAFDDAALPTRAAALSAYRALIENRRAAKKQDGMDATDAKDDGAGLGRMGDILANEILARTNHALTTPNGFAERLVWFWSNHFTVAANKALTVPLAGVYEREVIRGGLTGSFADLHLAVMRHAGMLLYLDQAQSIGPNSTVGRRRNAGLNENLAREALELHTLGPDGGYTQADVTEFARALTGWTLVSDRTRRFAGSGALEGDFVFLDMLHEPGARTVLGKRYAESGEAQARAILADLARSPATARRVATQLCRHFIADAPPPAAVDALAKVFLETGGDLPSVHKALAERPETWTATQSKFKAPNEFMISALRLAGVPRVDRRALLAAYGLLGQRPFGAPSPEGWPDTAEEWAAPDSVMKRLEWSQALAERTSARGAPAKIAEDALGPLLSARTREAVARAESAAQGFVLVLMSPEFQRR